MAKDQRRNRRYKKPQAHVMGNTRVRGKVTTSSVRSPRYELDLSERAATPEDIEHYRHGRQDKH